MDYVTNLVLQGAFSTVVALAVVYYIGREIRGLRHEINKLVLEVIRLCARNPTRK